MAAFANPEAVGASREPKSASRLFVGSEVGTLRRVLLHRPDLELKRLTPANKERLLFDDVLWVRRAQQEHDALADALAEVGVEVLYVQELLAQVLQDGDVRADVIARTFDAALVRPTPSEPAREWFDSLSADELAALLIGGIAWEELPFRPTGLAAYAPSRSGFALPPLPNQMFARDSSAWIYDGVSISRPAAEARRRESLHLDAVYRHHPLFADVVHEVWSDRLPLAAVLESRDVLVLGNGAVLIGMGDRVRPSTVEALAARLFAAGAARRVLAVPLPGAFSAKPLDSVLTMVDGDAFTVDLELKDCLQAIMLVPNRGVVGIEREGDLFAAVAEVLELPRLRLIDTGGDRDQPGREQWDNGNDVLALAPGVVVAYERNGETNARLRHEGIEVIAIEGFEVGRGRRGPRSLSCPIERDALPDYA